MKKTICLLAALFVVLLPSCKTKNENYSEEIEEKTEYYSDKFVVENGLSTYYIVSPKNPMSQESIATQELNYFIKESTNVDIPIINEREVKRTYRYISLGRTTQFANAFPDFDYSSLDNSLSNYFIATKDYCIYIVSGKNYKGYGTLYGVYDLLEDLIDYRYYHDSEIYYEHKDTINLPHYKDKFVVPSFDGRSISTLYTMSNASHTRRLRLINNSRGEEWNRATYGHNHLQYFVGPWDLDDNGVRYGESHPDWFIFPGQPRPAQNLRGLMINNGFCFTAGHELEHLIAQKMIKAIINEPESIYVMCAQEDTQNVCKCERCLRAMNEWAGTQSGLQIAFMNHIIEEVEEYLSVNQPGRQIQYLTFAYLPTIEPSVKRGEDGRPLKDKEGHCIPYSDKIKLHEKLRIYLAPIQANYGSPFSAPINLETKQILDGWASVAKNQIMMYLYDLNYRIYFVNFNNFGSVSGMYRECLEAGATYMLTQGVSDSNICCFDEMRSYVEANLMWNVNRSYEDLADDFLKHFYKDAYPYMKDIYELIRDRYAYYQALVQSSIGDTTGDIRNSGLYPFSLVRQLDLDISRALEAIKHIEEVDYSLYTTLKNRVMKEYLSVIYLKMSLYRGNYTTEEINEMLETWEYYIQLFGITHAGEGNGINNIFD